MKNRFGDRVGSRPLQVVGALAAPASGCCWRHQLGHADHRAARPRARAAHELLALVWVILAYMIASTVLVLTAGRLSDLFGRKRAYVGGFVGLRARLARRRLRRRADRADPVADPPGHRRGVPVRQRGRARHRRVPARAARPGDGDEHDGRRDRARARPGARRRARRDLAGSGCSGSTSRSRSRGAALGRGWCCASSPGPTASAATTSSARADVRRRASPGSCSASRAAGSRGWNDPHRDRRPDRRRRAAAAVRPDRAPLARADARPHDLPEPPVRRRQRRGVHQRARRASR